MRAGTNVLPVHTQSCANKTTIINIKVSMPHDHIQT